MARLPRITDFDIAHYVTQRGNRRQQVFIQEDDYTVYRDLLTQHCVTNGVEVWSYCFLSNEVHLILVPCTQEDLSRAIGETNRRYSGLHQRAARYCPPLVSGSIWLGCDGRSPSFGGVSVRGPKPGQSEIGRNGHRLTLVEHSSALARPQR